MGTNILGTHGGGGSTKASKIGYWYRLKAGLLRFGPSNRRSSQQILPEAAQPLKVIIDADLSDVLYQDIDNNFKQAKYFPTWPYRGITIAAVLTAISLILTSIMWLTNIYGNAILKLVSIRNDIDMVFELWRVPPTKPTLSVYIFNYTNHKKVVEGKEKPIVQEVGPYVFSERMERINVKFNPNGTVSFQENRTIVFDSEKSKRSLNEPVIVPNVPLITILKTFYSLYFLDQKILANFISSLDAQFFLNVTAKEFIWGHEDAFFEILKKTLRVVTQEEIKGFGFLDKRQGVHHDVVTMYTGENDLDNIGQITRWSGTDRIGCWGNTQCDKIQGSDGSLFPAKLTREGKPMYIYSPGMCRKLPLYYNKTTKSQDGFPVQEYHIDRNLFDYSNKTKENLCYQYQGKYPPNGVFNTGPCQNDKPIYASYPHFWQADPQLINSIEGLKPDENLHKSYFQIHKKLGICLKAKTRFQLNIMLYKVKYVDQTANFLNETLILPIGWLDYDSGELPKHFVNILNHLTYTAVYVEEILKWLSLIFMVISIIYFIVKIKFLVLHTSQI